ncbi:macro domain-containing protein [Nibrella viscosa]|uniref:Macro domain-containing protein n=1 Tax=Nibrella viscosa TaxID=1084524 RepID=A0ABP8K1L5_9BACT
MIRYVTGNLLDADAQALVNTVNTVGVMGKGIALQFKEHFPANFRIYKKACDNKELAPGKLLVTREQTTTGEKVIINFPTKTDWKRKSTYAYIEAGLQELARLIREEQLTSIALPPLGCGNGGLDWDKVRPMMEQYLGDLNADIQIYEPNEAVKSVLQQQNTRKKVELTPARAMLLYAMFSYERMDEAASLFVANKLAYFLQRLGENLQLKFVAHHYGPYTNQVEHVLYYLNGTYLTGLEQKSAKAFEPLVLNYDKLDEVVEYIRHNLSPAQQQRLQNLTRLIDGFQSALSLEVLASVDYILNEHGPLSVPEVYERIQSWSDRKKRIIQERHINIAMNQLQAYRQTGLHYAISE